MAGAAIVQGYRMVTDRMQQLVEQCAAVMYIVGMKDNIPSERA